MIHNIINIELKEFPVMDLVPCGTLKTLIADSGFNPGTDTLIDIALDIVHALAYLHELGIVHRDLKLSNLLVSFLDFRKF